MQPTPPSPDPLQDRRRWPSIQAQLLILLLPGIALMLAVDSWSDHQERTGKLESAYDEALLEPLIALDDSVHFDASGKIDLAAPFAVQSMFEAIQERHKHLHVGLAALDPVTAIPLTARTLLGVDDLPAPPPDTAAALSPTGADGALIGRTVFYTAAYHGYAVRVAALQREVTDATGQRFRLRVQAAESTERRADARQASLQREIRQDLRMLAVTALLVWLGIAWALRPLKRLRASLRERPPHDLQPLNGSGVPHEVLPLVDAVNHHIADHRQLLAEQGRFLADASHQLRTPLAIMMTQAGYALRERDPEILRETLRAIIAQLGRSRRLSDQLLAMAHASLVSDDTEPFPLMDLNAVAREVVLQYLPLAHEKHQDLGWGDVRGEDTPDEEAGIGAPAAPVHAHAAEMHEVLANLVHNAIVYTPSGGRITVTVSTRDGMALAEVRDDGPGIARTRRAGVFERFHQASPGPGKGPHGAGLGLAIARAYARRNGGDIELADPAASSPGSNSSTTGLRAILRLPLASNRQS